MRVVDDRVVWTATDLANAAECEFGLLRTLDHRLGRIEVVTDDDPLLAQLGLLGDDHEARELERLVKEFGEYDDVRHAGVFQVQRPRFEDLPACRDETQAVLHSGADVVFQAAFYDGSFQGYADFLIREHTSRGAAYVVCDAKLARHEKPKALLQVAAYVDQLQQAGVPVASEAELLLGDGRRTRFRTADIAPVFRERRDRLLRIIDERLAADQAVAWNDAAYLACGRCATCEAEVHASRDLLLVAGMRLTQRKKLREAAIATIDDLAARAAPVEGMPVRTFETLHAQAALQVRQVEPESGPPAVEYDVYDPDRLATLPTPSAGDVFFDFEGDPMWNDGDPAQWGLEYLFGIMKTPVEGRSRGTFRMFWADDRAAEKQALQDFIGYVQERRRRHPDMRIYHYASYERTALTRLAQRYGVCEAEVDQLLREGVLVDLYAVVRSSLRISQPSYSIKKLEPLYMGEDLRDDEVQDAATSILEYHRYCDAVSIDDQVLAAKVRGLIADYNEADCLSTLRLRDWLLDRAAEHGIESAASDVGEEVVAKEDDDAALLERSLLAWVGEGDRTPDQQAVAMLAAGLGYGKREDKPHWWAHFARAREAVDEWENDRDVFVSQEVVLEGDWEKPTSRSSPHRQLRMHGRWGVGSTCGVGAKVCGLYDVPVPEAANVPENALRGYARGGVTTIEMGADKQGRDSVLVDEILPKDVSPYDELPFALTPGSPVQFGPITNAIVELARSVDTNRALHPQPALDLLRRLPPRLQGGVALPSRGEPLSDILSAVRLLDHSYVAVQGPPGTGKTYVGSHVIKALVAEGWRVGVVAQSHAVVEHMLDAVVEAGVPGERVAKKGSGDVPQAWTVIDDKDYAEFLDAHDDGCVIGGTSWDFVNTGRVQREQLDLLVIDEAGQFSMAHTIGVSVSANRLLLLGDPQQLPQVSQGTHPEPVNGSALGWVMGGAPTMPPDRGYFLSRTRRMHPDLCARDSRLSYQDELFSEESVTTARLMADVAPGLRVRWVDHAGCSIESEQEAAAVVAQVRELLGTPWRNPSKFEGVRALADQDFIVVAPYNAQVNAIRSALDAADLGGVRVGTVDRFQGREAAVAIVSMTASAVGEIPRGVSFLLNRNRVNVAISRAMWLAVIVRSPALTNFMPSTPEGLLELGAFVGLCEADGETSIIP